MSQKSILRKPNDQSKIVNFAARASAKRNVRFVINEKEETKHAIPESESKYSESESESNMESEHSYSDWDDNYNNNNNKNKNEKNEMEVDDDSSSDYVPSDEDISSELEDVSTSEDEDKENEMEVDDDSSSDYVPSDDDNNNDDDDDDDDINDNNNNNNDDDEEEEEEEADFDEKVVNILSSLKYDTLTPSKYLFDWGSEYWYKLESTNAMTRENLTSFKRKIQSSRQWNNLISKVKMMVEKDRLE